jgi:putative membrane protein
MRHLILSWLIEAVSLLIVANVIPGIEVEGFGVALIAAIVIGLVNATIGVVFTILAIPFIFLTLGLFLIVINALMLKIAAAIVPGFRINGCLPAIFGAILLSLVQWSLNWLLRP